MGVGQVLSCLGVTFVLYVIYGPGVRVVSQSVCCPAGVVSSSRTVTSVREELTAEVLEKIKTRRDFFVLFYCYGQRKRVRKLFDKLTNHKSFVTSKIILTFF